MWYISVQVTPPHETSDVQVIPPHKTSADAMDVNTTTVKLAEISGEVGMYDFNHLQMFVSRSRVARQDPLLMILTGYGSDTSVSCYSSSIYTLQKSRWNAWISHTQWHRLVKKLEPQVFTCSYVAIIYMPKVSAGNFKLMVNSERLI